MNAKKIKENMGGVSSPMSTLANTPGMGNATPPSSSTGGVGSGDSWGNTIGGKPYTQAGKAKTKKRKAMKKKKLEEENLNPRDQIGMSMAKKMGVNPPFKKKKEKGNQNAIKQQKFEHEIITYDEFLQSLNEIYNTDIPTEPEIIQEFRDIFQEKYSYISYDFTDRQIAEFLSQKHINNLSLSKAADYFSDYLLSQGLADDVQE